MERITCPECGEWVEYGDGVPHACAACGCPDRPAEVPEDEGRPRRKRKKRRPEPERRAEGFSRDLAHLIGISLLLAVGGGLGAYSFAERSAAYWLAGVGLVASLIGAA